MQQNELTALLPLVYDTVGGDSHWELLLRALDRALPECRFALVETQNVDRFVLRFLCPSLPADIVKKVRNWRKDKGNPLNQYLQLPVGFVFDTVDVLGADTIRSSPLYDQMLHRLNIRNSLILTLRRSDIFSVSLIALYGKTDREVKQASKDSLTFLAPHMVKAVELSDQMESYKLDSHLARLATDHSTTAIFILDPEGRNRFHNAEAQRILDQKNGLNIDRQGRLCARISGETDDLQMKLQSLRTLHRKRRKDESSVLVESIIRQDATGTPYSVTARWHPELQVTRYHKANAFGGFMILIRDADQKDMIRPDLLRHRYGISRAEADVLNQLARGYTTERISRERGTSIRTVRNQIDSIQAKTATRDKMAMLAKVMREIFV